jgi:glycosyltransferase involved in cell wall biosynthesis
VQPVLASGPAISVLIPTFNRCDALLLCLAHLERQTFQDFEVIVVDDGSTDGTEHAIGEVLEHGRLALRYMRQQNSGPAKARNLAVSLAQAPLLVVIGDDIMASPTFLAEHLALHRAQPEPHIAGLGLTRWSETGQTVTPFMRWMDDSGTQFAYGDLLRGVEPRYIHFYTSNLSVKTELLRRHPFDERFTRERWMVEDMELGYRLEQKEGMRLVFLPAAYAEHIHPTDFDKACRRAAMAGVSLRLFDELWPDRPQPRRGRLHRALRGFLSRNDWLLGPVTAVTRLLTHVWCPNPLLSPVLAYHAETGRRRGGSDVAAP